jgi:hypothetical protein
MRRPYAATDHRVCIAYLFALLQTGSVIRAPASELLTLTTFADVPWNGPCYERLGFRQLTGTELTPGLRAVRAEEAAHGLDEWPRIAMRRELTARA